MIVLDASAAIEWLLQTSTGQREQQIFSQSESLHAPHLLDVEIVQVLRRLVRERVVSVPRADQAITDLLDLRINRYPHFVLLPRLGTVINDSMGQQLQFRKPRNRQHCGSQA